MAHYISLKDEKFTISLIGRPNVGKSTLFNTLMGSHEALVDKMPGLTRDRREGITYLYENLGDRLHLKKARAVPVRVVDTAGFEDVEALEEPQTRSVNKQMMKDMIMQTRNALIYSDLAIFMLDSTSGIHHHDIALHDWIMNKKFAMQNRELETTKESKPLNPQIIYDKPLKGLKDDKSYKKELELYELQKTEFQLKRQEANFKASFRNPLEEVDPDEVKIPKIIYVANKSEDGREGDIMAEAWKLGIDVPLFISAQHGDGMNDLYKAILDSIPESRYDEFENRMTKRVQRYNDYKQMMINELEDLKKLNADESDSHEMDYSANELSKEYDFLNPHPEYNSDFDSDNEINPLDTMTKAGYVSSVGGISTENSMKKKPIQLAVIGRPNVGKSTVVNAFLREDRVIANDLPGTTRDSVTIQWVHRGRRVTLVDTAGVDIKSRNKNRIDEMVRESMHKVLNYSHIALVMIDSMAAFTVQDFAIMSEVIGEGRGLVIAANKWDIVADKYKRKAVMWMNKQLEKRFRQAKGIPLTFVSAKTGIRVDKIMDEVLRVYEKWNTRVSTSLLNKWLTAMKRVHKMPGMGGKHLKIRYIMQIKARPPTFFIFVNDINLVPEVYKRFLRNSLIKEFGFEGVPVRLLFRDNKYMYDTKDAAGLPLSQRTIMNRIALSRGMDTLLFYIFDIERKGESITFRRRLAGAKFLFHRKQINPKRTK